MNTVSAKQGDFSIIVTTMKTERQARALAAEILKEKLAACVQIQKIESFYRWKDKIEHGNEHILTIKTQTSLFSALSEIIKKNHDYQTPEIIQIPILDGMPEYLGWIKDMTS
jgi:periplasmic divalent cation tolerance protein